MQVGRIFSSFIDAFNGTNKKIPYIHSLLIKRRWIVVLFIGLLTVTIEAIEHYLHGESLLGSHFIAEFLIFGVFVPLVGFGLLSFIDRVERERDSVLRDIDNHLVNSHELVRTTNWDELVQRIVQYPATVMPTQSAALNLYDPTLAQFEQVATWGQNGDAPLHIHSPAVDCQTCALALSSTINLFTPCPVINGDQIPEDSIRYCLPLVYGDTMVGMLTLAVRKDQVIDRIQARTLAGLAPEIAFAIETAKQKRLSENERMNASRDERRRIAQNLHDTLGQNLSYIRLKLDQLSDQDTLLGIAAVKKDLDQMRAIADEAYQQVRGTLVALRSDSEVDFEESIWEYAQSMADRSNLNFQFRIHGQPVPLNPQIQLQALYICREALNNIEKHAKAQSIEVDLVWGEDDLTINIADDGQGFQLNMGQKDNQYGMIIMSERAEKINGQLSISTAMNTGSEVSLWLPTSSSPTGSRSIDISETVEAKNSD